jgi:predicted PurR-regulated permease PerM
VRAVPPHMRDDLLYFMDSVRRAFGGFLRGQLILGAVYGLGTAAVMTAAGLDFTLVASVFAALAMLIPFLGQVLAVLPPAAIALLIHPEHVWWILLLLIALQVVVINIISPRVMGHTVGVHPLLVFVAVLVGAKFAGLWGALFGVPIAGVVVAMVAFYRLTIEERRLRAAALATGNGTLAAQDPVRHEEPVPATPR